MAYALLAHTLNLVGHQIPLFLLAFGVLYFVLGFAIKPLGGALHLPIAMLAIAASLAWFVVNGATPWGIFLSSDVLTVLGVGIVLVVLGRIFAA